MQLRINFEIVSLDTGLAISSHLGFAEAVSELERMADHQELVTGQRFRIEMVAVELAALQQ